MQIAARAAGAPPSSGAIWAFERSLERWCCERAGPSIRSDERLRPKRAHRLFSGSCLASTTKYRMAQGTGPSVGLSRRFCRAHLTGNLTLQFHTSHHRAALPRNAGPQGFPSSWDRPAATDLHESGSDRRHHTTRDKAPTYSHNCLCRSTASTRRRHSTAAGAAQRNQRHSCDDTKFYEISQVVFKGMGKFKCY